MPTAKVVYGYAGRRPSKRPLQMCATNLTPAPTVNEAAASLKGFAPDTPCCPRQDQHRGHQLRPDHQLQMHAFQGREVGSSVATIISRNLTHQTDAFDRPAPGWPTRRKE